MSVLADLSAMTLIGALRSDAALAALVHAIGDDGERASTVPIIWIAEQAAIPWGGKDRAGSEVRIDLGVRDRGDSARSAEIAEAVEAVIAGLPRSFAGWETGEWLILRRRMLRQPGGDRRLIWSLRLRGWPGD